MESMVDKQEIIDGPLGSSLFFRYSVLIVAFGVIHRGLLFWNHYQDLANLISENPNWLTWQYLTIPALTEHLGMSLVYLQQTPPIPNLILGLAAKTFGWPYGTAYVLIVFQSLLSIGTAFLLFRLLCGITRTPYLGCVISIVFLLSADILVMEYCAFGQTFYENLAMFLLLLAAYFYCRTVHTEKILYSLGLGLAVGFLALTRASFSYFFILPPVFLLFSTPSERPGKIRNLLLTYFVCILMTQGVWCAKNYAVYGTPSLSTSSWKGVNFAVGLIKVGRGHDLIQVILDEKDRYPQWFIEMIENEGLVNWHPPAFGSYMPKTIQEQEESIQTRLHNTNRSENSIGQRVISDLYMKAYQRFLLKKPKVVVLKFLQSYRCFWEPIRNYGIKYLALLYVEPEIRNSFYITHALRAAVAEGVCANQYLMKGTPANRLRKSTCFYTIPYLPTLVLIANIVVIHILAPLLIFSMIVCMVKHKRLVLPKEFIFLLVCYLYAVVVMNLSEYDENMRFRLSIEPLIWLTSAYAGSIILSKRKEIAGLFRPAG